MTKIMVVDDDPSLRALLTVWLRGRDCQVILAADGYQAVQLAVTERPDVILLDISMPAGGGFSVHDRLRDLSSVASVPIIYMSADQTAEPKALAAGAARFLAKPLRKDTLVRTVHQVYPPFAPSVE